MGNLGTIDVRHTTYGRKLPYNHGPMEVALMTARRLEVRLDQEHHRKLEEITAARGARVSDLVRELIDQAYEEVQLAERLAAVRSISELELEDMPEPDELSRQLARTYDVPDLY